MRSLNTERNESTVRVPLDPGAAAPDFALRGEEAAEPADDAPRSLLELTRGRPVLLAFYPLPHSHVCRDDLKQLDRWLEELGDSRPRTLAISISGVDHASEFFRLHEIRHLEPVADVELHIARDYGVARSEGMSERASVLVGSGGTILRAAVHPFCFPRPCDRLAEWLESAGGR